MHLKFVTSSLEVTTTLDHPDAICKHPKFKKNKQTVIVITGWLSDVNTTNIALERLHNAYKKRDVNFMVRRKTKQKIPLWGSKGALLIYANTLSDLNSGVFFVSKWKSFFAPFF